MATIYIVLLLVCGLIAYYTSRSGHRWKIVAAFVLGMIGGWIVGLPLIAFWADGNTGDMSRGIGTGFWVGLMGSIGGIWFGRQNTSRQSSAPQSSVEGVSGATLPDNSQRPYNDNSVKVAELEASLSKYKPDILDKAKKICGDDFSRIDDVYVALRVKQLHSEWPPITLDFGSPPNDYANEPAQRDETNVSLNKPTKASHSGWFRVGLLMTIIWTVGATTFVYLQHENAVNDIASLIYESRYDEGWAVVKIVTDYFDCQFTGDLPGDASTVIMTRSLTSCSPRLDALSILYLPAFGLIWLVAPLARLSFLWVREGFER